MSDRTSSCAERIGTELAETEQSYARLWQRLEAIDKTDDSLAAVYEELQPLSIDVKPVMVVLLSWGGPSDWLEIELDSTRAHDVERVTYHYADWFDHAERAVSADAAPALWRAAEYYAEEADGLHGEPYGKDR